MVRTIRLANARAAHDFTPHTVELAPKCNRDEQHKPVETLAEFLELPFADKLRFFGAAVGTWAVFMLSMWAFL